MAQELQIANRPPVEMRDKGTLLQFIIAASSFRNGCTAVTWRVCCIQGETCRRDGRFRLGTHHLQKDSGIVVTVRTGIRRDCGLRSTLNFNRVSM